MQYEFSLKSSSNWYRYLNHWKGDKLAHILRVNDTNIEDIIMKLVEEHKVPGLSLAAIKNGQVDWSRGFGVLDIGTQSPVETTSLFQAASMSKSVTALAILRLVDEGRINLDTGIDQYITSWKIPNCYESSSHITVRHILSHSSGLSIDGFHGYPRMQSRLPNTVEILNGTYPATNPPVEPTWISGSQSAYSGGAFCVLQLLIEEITNQSFEVAMQRLIFDPLGMFNSTFVQPSSDVEVSNYASGYLPDGRPIDGRFNLYPEMAAAGLWTTPSDLAQFVIEIQQCYQGKSTKVLSQLLAREMLTPQGSVLWENTPVGLGVMLDGDGSNTRFAHPGHNAGFLGAFIGYREKGLGLALMVNFDGAPNILLDVTNEIVKAYEWTGYPN